MSERLRGEIKIKAERERRKQRLFIKVYLKETVEKPTENWIVGTKN